VAKDVGATLELLGVIEPSPPEVAAELNPVLRAQRMLTCKKAQVEKYLRDMAEKLADVGMRVTATTVEGEAAECIVAEAEKQPDTLIAMCTHGRSGIPRWLMGSVADRVLHGSTNALLFVRAQTPEDLVPGVRLSSIIVPLDESALAEEVLPHVVALAKPRELKVVLVTVTPPAWEYYRHVDYPVPNYDRHIEEVDAQALGYLRRVAQGLHDQGVSSTEEILLHGHAGGAIAGLAQATEGNMVAMTTHGRSGVGRWVLGSVTDKVVRQSGEPVLVIRSSRDGFKDREPARP
jgi:nucleotide-binding universal stress UspA family protein